MTTQELEQPPPTELDDQRVEDDATEVQPFRYTISSYGADYPVDSLIKRIREGAIYIPEFQRGFVWDIKDASRFVESLLLGLPVPSIFLSKEPDTGKLLVVDGQQRLLSLQYFYDGVWRPGKREFELKGVQPEYAGKTYRTLHDEDRRRLDDAILHATIFKQDEPSDDESGIYQVFERLNSGGKKLTPQEIRSAVHHSGAIRNLLAQLNADPNWRAIYGPPDERMRDQELILRFLALYSDGERYSAPMVEFLNAFMGRNKNIDEDKYGWFAAAFVDSIRAIARVLGERAFRPVKALNAAVFDAVMVGTAKRLARGVVQDEPALRKAYEDLLNNEDFKNACGRGTASAERVSTRLRLAKQAFETVP